METPVKVEKSPSADLASYGGGTVEEQVQNVVNSKGVVLFAKTTCPFCSEVRRTLDALDAEYSTFNVNLMSNGTAVHDALKKLTGQVTVPYVYVNKEFLGGCDSTKLLEQQGKLLPKLQAAAAIKPTQQRKRFSTIKTCSAVTARQAPRCLFSFPDTLDDRAVRLNGVWGFIISLLVAVFWKRRAAHWVMVGLLIDFVLRFLGGGFFSPLGSLSVFCTSVMEMFGSKPRLIPGPPKQFATLCGIMFSGLASFFYLTSVHESKLRIVGLSFTCGLGMATFLEGFLGFCLGCYFFGIGVTLGLAPKDVYTVHANSRAEIDLTWHEMNKRLNEGAGQRHKKHFSNDSPTVIDYTYKAKTDDMTREDFNILKHVKMSHFAMHLSIVGLAAAWKFATALGAPSAVWKAIAIGGATWAFLWLVMYVAKALLHPRRVIKEWQCNIQGNTFVLPFICFELYALLITDWSWQCGFVFFWFGAPASLLIGIIRVGDWISMRKEIEHINAAWMIAPVAGFITAMVGPLLDRTFVDTMQFWFAFSFVMWLLLFAVTFYKAIIHTDNDDRVRAFLGMWVAAPAVGSVAYWQLYTGGMAPSLALGNDFIFINMVWVAVAMFLVLSWGFVRPYFARLKFDMSYWVAGFPLDALATCTIVYSLAKPGHLSHGIALAALAAATGTNTVLGLHTLAGILRRRVFVPDYKWGPLSFMKLTHEAFKEHMARMKVVLDAMAEMEGGGASAGDFQALWQEFIAMHHEHSRHEDDIVFPVYAQFFPHVADAFHAEHKDGHEELDRVSSLVQQLVGSGKDMRGEILAGLRSEFTVAMRHMLEHLDGEMNHLQGIPRRYLPIEMHKQIVRKVWEQTPAESWFDMLPWVVNNLPMLQQRTRFLKTFLWAMPERAQQIGMMVALGVDAVQWRRITDELPELIPRGAAGWQKYY